jgi:hypothetical protein
MLTLLGPPVRYVNVLSYGVIYMCTVNKKSSSCLRVYGLELFLRASFRQLKQTFLLI